MSNEQFKTKIIPGATVVAITPDHSLAIAKVEGIKGDDVFVKHGGLIHQADAASTVAAVFAKQFYSVDEALEIIDLLTEYGAFPGLETVETVNA